MTTEKPAYTKTTEAELRAALSGCAPGANKMVVSLGKPGVRIAFLEINSDLSDEVFFRSAVTLHPQDAIQLRDLLTAMLKGIEEKFVEVQVSGGDNG